MVLGPGLMLLMLDFTEFKICHGSIHGLPPFARVIAGLIPVVTGSCYGSVCDTVNGASFEIGLLKSVYSHDTVSQIHL